jgi:hypothetical protein
VTQPVSGQADSGQPPVAPPVLIGGSDGTNTRTLLVDSTGAIVTSAVVTPPTTIYNGAKTVTTHGTAVALASSQAIESAVVVRAALANTGTIYVGNSGVTSANGLQLAAGDAVTLAVANLATVFIDASADTQSVTFIAT